MRVIAGERRGFRLKSPKNKDIRPTEDRIKETIFNIISPILQGSTVIDCFSGTGGIGIEFLSRGASYVYFIDRSRDAVRLIQENIEHTKYEDRSEVLAGDFIRIISQLEHQKIRPGYVYLDPPFHDIELLDRALDMLDDSGLCSSNCLIIVESNISYQNTNEYSTFSLVDRRDYKTKSISFYKGGVF